MSTEAKDTAAAAAAADQEATATNEQKRSPSDFLKAVLGRPVNVRLNTGTDYRGVLACLDGYMNIAMEQTEEYVDGQLKSKYGDCFIRGNNVMYISSQKR
mmetsp:Transcript_4578/g.10163  ORF Transcript_4578/g.10163 Transcript_4578/m.10163 type:complete len:100 (-) Transcript_4578:292-591(-)|eukprot:g9410.t1 g9410   contig36:510352-511287(-)